MRYVAYFFLLSGLMTSAAWGQTSRKNQSVVVKCGALSCTASVSSVRKADPEVKLGTFKSLPQSAIRRADCSVKLETFRAFPTPSSGVHAAGYEVKVGTFKSLPTTKSPIAVLQAPQVERNAKVELLVG